LKFALEKSVKEVKNMMELIIDEKMRKIESEKNENFDEPKKI